jgi:hypothetical protein
MTRSTGQYCCVIAALSLCLALVVFSIGGANTTARADARTGDDPRPPLRLEDVEEALELLAPAAQRYALTGSASDRQRFAYLLSRLSETSVVADRGVADTERSERLQLLDAAHHMLRRIDELGREILALPGSGATRAAAPQVGALVRLGDKTLAALGQLRAAPAAQPANTKRTTVGPNASASVVPEGVAVLLVTIVCAVSMALVSATRQLDLARRR